MRAWSGWIVLALLAAGLWSLPSDGQDALPPVPEGVEVQARGPVHEAFAPLAGDPVATAVVPRQPPAPIEELPPDQKPEGRVVWLSGYWAWDEDRNDFLWVSGLWRTPPPGKQWIAGYWREGTGGWQWVPGFWATARGAAPGGAPPAGAAPPPPPEQQITYLPDPPKMPDVAPPGAPPSPDTFYVPSAYIWNGRAYALRAGYWARVQPGYVWVPDHLRWTPSGCVYIPGYWDLALDRRGVLYAPVYIRPAIIRPGFVYTPAYAVRDTVIVEALWVRPTTCHYYFGDYYEARYSRLGYESCVVYSRRRYDSIIVYETYRRRDPAWINVQINVYNNRLAGVAPRPPRTVVINRVTNVTNLTMVAPTRTVVVAKNTRMVVIDHTTRLEARKQAVAVQQVAVLRTRTEVPVRPGAPRTARVVQLAVPHAQPVQKGFRAAPPPVVRHVPPAARLAPPIGARPAPGKPVPGVPIRPPTPGVPVPPKAQTPVPLVRPGAPQAPRPGTTPPRPGSKLPPGRRPPPKDKDKERDRR